jgi:hypothetical protein
MRSHNSLLYIGEFVMTASTASAPESVLPTADAYLVLGLATCFLKQEGEVEEVQIIEPIPSAALETLLKGVATSYRFAYATTFGTVIDGDTLQKPVEFPDDANFCDEFVDRAIAAARTYQRYPHTQNHLSVGTVYREFNYSTERKRVLNSARTVRAEDNVKQHAHTHKVL